LTNVVICVYVQETNEIEFVAQFTGSRWMAIGWKHENSESYCTNISQFVTQSKTAQTKVPNELTEGNRLLLPLNYLMSSFAVPDDYYEDDVTISSDISSKSDRRLPAANVIKSEPPQSLAAITDVKVEGRVENNI